MRTVVISVGSDRLDDLGQFTKFILWAVNKEYSIHDISEAIELSELIVEDEVAYLQQIGFVQENDAGQFVTETGLGYIALLSAIDSFNTQKHTARLNYFSGDLSEINPLVVTTLPSNENVLPEKLSKFIVQNRDYHPLQKYAKSKFEHAFSHLRPEFYESLYFYMSSGVHDAVVYQKYKILDIPALCKQSTNSGDTMLILERELLKYEFTYTDDRLLRYRSVLDTLEKLHQFDSTLLSDAADTLLQWAKNEQIVNATTKPLIFDTATGTPLEEYPPAPPINTRNIPYIPKLHIPPRECSYSDYINISSNSGAVLYKRNFKSEERSLFQQMIPFTCFEEDLSWDES